MMTDRMYLLLERLQRIDDALRLAESAARPDPRRLALLRLRRAWMRRQLERRSATAVRVLVPLTA